MVSQINAGGHRLETSFEIPIEHSNSVLSFEISKGIEKSGSGIVGQGTLAIDEIRDEIAIIEESVLLGETEILEQDRRAFNMKKHELEISYMKAAHVLPFYIEYGLAETEGRSCKSVTCSYRT